MAKRSKAGRHWWKTIKPGEEQMFEAETAPATKVTRKGRQDYIATWNKAAFHHEFKMRHEKRRKFKTYVELPMIERLQLCRQFEAIEPSSFTVYQETDLLGKLPLDGFSSFRAQSWNLNAIDKTLKEQFIALIKEERRRLGIPDPTRDPVVKTKAVPFELLEKWDVELAGGEKLDGDRRSHLEQRKAIFMAHEKKLKALDPRLWGVIKPVKR